MPQTSSTIEKLRSVFGPLSHAPPEPSRREDDAKKRAAAEQSAYVAEQLPQAPVYHQKTGVLLVPSKRFDGSSEDPPWNMPEPILWDWLRTTEIEHIEERCLSGRSGSFWARYRNYDGQLRSAFLRMSGGAKSHVFEHLGTEYAFEGQYDLLKREQAAYEAMKALGCEDMAPPLAAKEVNLVPLISDAVRQAVAREMKIAPVLVDETLGLVGLLQAVPLQAANFVEHWSQLGPDEVNRWERASDRLRHSIYRAILLDFLFGVANRMLCDHLYSKSSDSLAVYGFECSFPHPGLTAEWYLAMRSKGWGRKFSGPFEEPVAGAPASGVDTLSFLATFPEAQQEELAMTAKQVVKAFDERTATLLVQVMAEIGIPVANIGGFISRFVFLENDPDGFMGNSFDYVRSVLVPLRRGYGLDEGRIKMVAETTSRIMSQALEAEFDFSQSVQEPVPEGTVFTI